MNTSNNLNSWLLIEWHNLPYNAMRSDSNLEVKLLTWTESCDRWACCSWVGQALSGCLSWSNRLRSLTGPHREQRENCFLAASLYTVNTAGRLMINLSPKGCYLAWSCYTGYICTHWLMSELNQYHAVVRLSRIRNACIYLLGLHLFPKQNSGFAQEFRKPMLCSLAMLCFGHVTACVRSKTD